MQITKTIFAIALMSAMQLSSNAQETKTIKKNDGTQVYLYSAMGIGNAKAYRFKENSHKQLSLNQRNTSTMTQIGIGLLVYQNDEMSIGIESGGQMEEVELSFMSDSTTYSLIGNKLTIPLQAVFTSQHEIFTHFVKLGVTYSILSNNDETFLENSPMPTANSKAENFGFTYAIGLGLNISKGTSMQLFYQGNQDLIGGDLLSTSNSLNLGIAFDIF